MMEAVWARSTPISCIHPGWNPINGREQVLESWQSILTGPAAPAIRCRNAEATIVGETGIVICFEEIEGRFLIATNLFVLEDGGWRMVHHHAGPASAPPLGVEEETGKGELLN